MHLLLYFNYEIKIFLDSSSIFLDLHTYTLKQYTSRVALMHSSALLCIKMTNSLQLELSRV